MNLRNKRLTWEWRRGYVLWVGERAICFFLQNPVVTFHRENNLIFVSHENKFSGENSKKKKRKQFKWSIPGQIDQQNFITSRHTLTLDTFNKGPCRHGCKQFILIMSITYIDDNVKTLNLKTECFRSTRYILPREWIRMWTSSHINYIFVYIFFPKFNLNSKFMKRFDWPCPENFIVKRVWYLWQSKIQNGHNRRTFFFVHMGP